MTQNAIAGIQDFYGLQLPDSNMDGQADAPPPVPVRRPLAPPDQSAQAASPSGFTFNPIPSAPSAPQANPYRVTPAQANGTPGGGGTETSGPPPGSGGPDFGAPPSQQTPSKAYYVWKAIEQALGARHPLFAAIAGAQTAEGSRMLAQNASARQQYEDQQKAQLQNAQTKWYTNRPIETPTTVSLKDYQTRWKPLNPDGNWSDYAAEMAGKKAAAVSDAREPAIDDRLTRRLDAQYQSLQDRLDAQASKPSPVAKFSPAQTFTGKDGNTYTQTTNNLTGDVTIRDMDGKRVSGQQMAGRVGAVPAPKTSLDDKAREAYRAKQLDGDITDEALQDKMIEYDRKMKTTSPAVSAKMSKGENWKGKDGGLIGRMFGGAPSGPVGGVPVGDAGSPAPVAAEAAPQPHAASNAQEGATATLKDGSKVVLGRGRDGKLAWLPLGR